MGVLASSRSASAKAAAVLVGCVTLLAATACNAIFGWNEAQHDTAGDAGDGGIAPGLDAKPNDAHPSEDAPAEQDAGDAGNLNPYTCEGYCALVMQNCVIPNQEYTTLDVCLAMCPHFEPGIPGESSNDSRACRAYHAMGAGNDPVTHCKHAGPLGGGECGDDPCKAFCDLDVALCASHGNPYDGGVIPCRDACKSFQYVTVDAGDLTLEEGNTLNCRLYHLESAYDPTPGAADEHCKHTKVVSETCF